MKDMKDMKDIFNIRMHLMVLLITIASESLGVQKFSIGIGVVLLLPLFYAFVIGVVMNPYVTRFASKVLRKDDVKKVSPVIIVAILPFMAKFGTLIGPAMGSILEAGPALILQELGNLVTMLIAMPIAVLVFKMRREAIGATYSIGREPNIAIISDKYGLNSDEGIGVMGVYVVGTLFGTIVFATMASFLGSTGIFSPQALAMACGVGSGSMTAACSGALAEIFPAMKDEVLAFAGASNLLTNATGLYIGLFVALPLAEKMYEKLSGKK